MMLISAPYTSPSSRGSIATVAIQKYPLRHCHNSGLPHSRRSLAMTNLRQLFDLLFFLSIFILLLLFAFPVIAATPQVQEVTAPKSGITAWLIEDKTLPMLSLRLAFAGGGAANDADGQEGRATMVSDLLLEGAGDMDALEFRRTLQSSAIDMSFSVDEDYLYTSLKSLTEHRDKAFELLALALTKPRFDAAAVERIRAQQLTLLRKLAERPSNIAIRTLYKNLFPDHPYGRSPHGTEEAVTAITAAQLAALPQQYFARSNMIVAVAGDISAKELARLLDKYFSALPEKPQAVSYVKDTEPQWFDKPVTVKRDIPQAVVRFALPAVRRSSPDFYALYLMNHILGGGTLTSRFARAIREEKGLAYYANSYIDIRQHAYIISGRFGTRSSEARAAISIMRDVIRNAVAKGFTQEELDHARNYVVSSFPLRLDSTSSIADYLLIMQLHDLGIDYLQKRNDYFDAVTLEDVNRVGRVALGKVEPSIVIVGNPD